jgi:hypothetical protein
MRHHLVEKLRPLGVEAGYGYGGQSTATDGRGRAVPRYSRGRAMWLD